MKIQRDLYDLTKKRPRAPNISDLRAFRNITFSLDAPSYMDSLNYDLFPWQRNVLRDRSKYIIINGCRQAGKSTIMSGKVCHHAKFFPKSLSVILAPTLKQSQEDMEKIKNFIAMDPSYPELLKKNDSEIKTANGSRILVLTATDDAARGFSKPDIVLFDEASRIETSVYDAVKPMITGNKNAQIIEISTPNGKSGFFWEHWQKKRFKRYLVTAPWEAYDSPDGPQLTPRTIDERILFRYCLPDGMQCELFESPRHGEYQEQMENLDDMETIRKYQQEFLCYFVDSEDQVFRQDLIEPLFESKAAPPLVLDMDFPEAQQMDAFKGEYEIL